ncbi:MAG: histidine phosphatase family protein [Clostridia bacterium]|nr:histidine phosphatase family protein [Clostridia bacterium]
MRILIVRHGDPDYSIDSLTPKGRVEAELLSDRLSKTKIDYCYVSPLGRARHTAQYTLDKIGKEATVCPWLREFAARIERPDREESIAWDWRPKDWVNIDVLYDHEKWYDEPRMAAGNVKDEYLWVANGLDELLKGHGYERCGRYYKAVRPNDDTLVFFCHFGLECVLLSHMLNISPMQLWHGFCAAPTSVTTIYTEEREEGIASFRVSSFGDISHLYVAGEEPSFSARFCETYNNPEQRHD